MKGKLIGIYLAISFFFGTWGYFFGPYQYRSFAYNLGVGIAWPVTVFKSDPELDGSSDEAFSLSLQEMEQAHPLQALQIEYAVGVVTTLIHAESDESFDGDQIRAMFVPSGKLPDGMFSNLWKINSLKEELKDRLDGMDLDDLISEAEDAKEELLELAEERPVPKKPEPAVQATPTPAPTPAQPVITSEAETPSTYAQSYEEPVTASTAASQGGEACYDQKLAAFRAEVGEEAPVSFDMINEWRGECGLPPEA